MAHGLLTEVTKYIVKKDLLLSRFSQFDDKPERYLVWKQSFSNIVKEIEVTPTEELDLLVRWLGPQSSKQALSLRSSNAHNNTQALTKIWKRLDKRYGSAELVETSIKNRIEQFPRLIGKDYGKLYELSDLLAEIESVKTNEKYRTLFSYYDSLSGVNPILSKLPSFIQNKWIDHAMRYKNEHSLVYPPFSIFTEFVRNMSVRMNDPSFKF